MSTGVTEKIVEIVEIIAPNIKFDIGSLNHIIRKNAHFFAYLVLGIFVENGLRGSGVSGYKGFTLALLIWVLYAISDEVHQLYVPGRGGQVKDVIIDSAVAVFGIGVYKWLNRKVELSQDRT